MSIKDAVVIAIVGILFGLGLAHGLDHQLATEALHVEVPDAGSH